MDMDRYKRLVEELAYANEQYESCEREIAKLQEDFQRNLYSMEVLSRCAAFKEQARADGGAVGPSEDEELYAVLTPCGEVFEKGPSFERLLEAARADQEKVKALLMGARARAEKWRVKVQKLEASAPQLF